jgi:hypothetical protein
VTKGQSAKPPANPKKPGHTFDGWEGNYNNITDNTIITAKWRENVPGQQYYTVTFMVDGNVLFAQAVLEGQSATPPANPTKSGYTFDGWDRGYTNITGNTTITARWKAITGEQPITLTIPDQGEGAFSVSEFTIYKTGLLQTRTITLDGAWASVQWYVGRTMETPAEDRSITINSANYPKGTYELTAVVTKADGSSWSKSISFMVED